MPKNGRPPIPTNLKLLKGETRPSKINPHEPKLPPGMPDAPDELSPEARGIWDKLVVQLDKMGILTTIDQIVLGLLCAEIARLRKLSKLYDESTPLIQDGRGQLRKNPLAQLVRDSTLVVARLSYEFGMTPSARAKLISNNWDDESDLERLLS